MTSVQMTQTVPPGQLDERRHDGWPGSVPAPERRVIWTVILVGVAGFLAIAVQFRLAGLSVIQSDAIDYLAQSGHWWRRDTHLPLFAFLVWAARVLTFHRVDPALVMQAVTLAAWSVSVYFTVRTLALVVPESGWWGAALYGLFPFAGLTYAVLPISDSLALATLAAAFYYLVRGRWWPLTVALAAAVVTHKGLWPFAALMGLIGVWRRGYPLWQFLLAGVPLAAFWGWGIATGGSWLWVIRRDMQVNLISHSARPVLDGVIGTLMSGGKRGLVKGGMLLALLCAMVYVVYLHLRRRQFEMLSLALPVVGLLVVLNQWEAWASVRFGKTAVVPLMAVLPARWLARLNRRPWLTVAFVLALVATQFVYAAYMIKYFKTPAMSDRQKVYDW